MSHPHCAAEKNDYLSSEDLGLLHREIPRHVAIIMDGNRRWAKKRNSSNFLQGHWAGVEIIPLIVQAASDIGIKILTLFAFSTENWARSPFEVETLMKIFETYLKKNRPLMIEQGVRFHTIGHLFPFPENLKKEIAYTKEATQTGKGLDLVLAMNYGGRDDVRRGVCSLIEDLLKGKVDKQHITESLIASYLDTAPFGDPDLLIRTSGERRISNFLLWQLAYSEVFITDVLWPDFTPRDLLLAVIDFQKRQRRLGR